MITHRARERWMLKRACRAVRRWDATGTVTTFEQLVSQNAVLDAGGARLRALGAGRASALRFAGGLLERGELDGLFGWPSKPVGIRGRSTRQPAEKGH